MGGGGRRGHTVSHPGYLHSPLQMFGPENGVCNYLAVVTIYGLYVVCLKNYLTKGVGGGGERVVVVGGGGGHPRTPLF